MSRASSGDDGPDDHRLGHSAVHGDTELLCRYHLDAAAMEGRREGTTITEHWACATSARSCGRRWPDTIGIHSANDGKLDAFLRVVCEELSEACIA